MSQNEAKWEQPCRKCSAGRDEPCRTTSGRRAEQVHWGRGSYIPGIPRQRRDRQPAVAAAGRYIDSADQADYDERRYG